MCACVQFVSIKTSDSLDEEAVAQSDSEGPNSCEMAGR